jgi:hypothetical protein
MAFPAITQQELDKAISVNQAISDGMLAALERLQILTKGQASSFGAAASIILSVADAINSGQFGKAFAGAGSGIFAAHFTNELAKVARLGPVGAAAAVAVASYSASELAKVYYSVHVGDDFAWTEFGRIMTDSTAKWISSGQELTVGGLQTTFVNELISSPLFRTPGGQNLFNMLSSNGDIIAANIQNAISTGALNFDSNLRLEAERRRKDLRRRGERRERCAISILHFFKSQPF